MAVDASAILAILLKEPDADRFDTALADAGGGVMSAVNHWEVLVRAWASFGDPGRDAAEGVLDRLGVKIVPATDEDARAAASAFERFGKRSGGRLNLGDCFAYALARREGHGLLFKGGDFPKTDVLAAG